MMGKYCLKDHLDPYYHPSPPVNNIVSSSLDLLIFISKASSCLVPAFAYILPLDGQVRLVSLQTDNFHLFLCQQTDRRYTSVCTLSKR
jgi:hypothetical protein